MMDEIIKKELEERKDNSKPTLLLHACCAPCSSYVLECLKDYFDITILFYNPNISPFEEFEKRYNELNKLIIDMPGCNGVKVVNIGYNPKEFEEISKGLEDLPEGGERCFKCYNLRLSAAAMYALDNKYDYFTTTLSISPYKNSMKLNEIGEQLSDKYNIKYLYADFKKKNGYKRSIELSKEYGLYRQDYCGCIYSKRDREKMKAKYEN